MLMRRSLLLASLVATVIPAAADEGMWLFTNPPRALLKERHGFNLTDDWLEHVRLSSVRFESGGSASFVSANGLVITNHHVGSEAIQKLSSKEHDYLRDGFHAKSRAEELKCVDEELNVLQSIEDVTERVNRGVPQGADAQAAFAARRKVIAEIEKESQDKTGLKSEVVTLYQGGQYHLYRFKRYSDVRLVFAPEQQIAFYGGDPDNFEFPRYDLDFSLFRVYENDQPAKIEHFLKFNPNGPKEGELTFVSGHPGRTSRLMTVSELVFLRDVNFPWLLSYLKRLEVLMKAWGDRSEENNRRCKDDQFGVQNSRKARDGGHAGLMDPALMGRKAKAEADFKAKLAGKPEFAEALAAYGKIDQASEFYRQNFVRHRVLERGSAFGANLFGIARTLLRAGEELSKPNGERLKEFGDAGKATLERDLLSEKPLYQDYEILRLADGLTFLAEQLGTENELVQKVLAGKSPRQRASELVTGSKVADVPFRKKLYEGGAAAVKAANDPLVELARTVDTEARAVRKAWEEREETVKQAHAAIAKARFALEGTNNYPDATFSLRLAFGPVKGFEENGTTVPAMTQLGGLYARGEEMKFRPPFDVPERWMNRKSAVNFDTPYNFVSTADIIGGNSGSPVINRAGEWVGIIFDGNIQSLVLDFAYDDVQARAVSVHAAAIIEGLRKVYDAPALADELINGK